MAGSKELRATNSTERIVYQFKIVLLATEPAVWRRILVPEGTLDDLHAAIQGAMGWTNSHLHLFEIAGRQFGDPELRDQDWSESVVISSVQTSLSALFGIGRTPENNYYTYDLGDDWRHRIKFEGVWPAENRRRYPCCIGGARACPPEDIGGTAGYTDFLRAISKRRSRQRRSYPVLVGGAFDADDFSAARANMSMLNGLPNWRCS